MPRTPIVAIVDAYSTSRMLAPLFAERGYDCIHVQSTEEIPAPAAHSFLSENFVANIIHRGDDAATIAAIAAYEPVGVIPGMEMGVEFADLVSETLGLRTNGTALSTARRNKFEMIEAVRAAGLPATEQIQTADWDALAGWHAGLGGKRVVIKPKTSLGNDGVFFCDDLDEVRGAFEALRDGADILGVPHSGLVAQEYIVGGEFCINTVSLDGVHHVCDIWRYEHLNVNGVRDLLGAFHLLPACDPESIRLAEYTFMVLDALGIKNGPAHTELRLTKDGPRLIETGARVAGADLPILTTTAIGDGHLEWTVDATVDPERFKARCYDEYEIVKHAVSTLMISPKAGKLVSYPLMEQVEALESFHRARVFAKPGGRVPMTINDWTVPVIIQLAHEVRGSVQRDYATVRYLDGPTFYQLEEGS